MTSSKVKHPLPPCPKTPNCIRTSKTYKAGLEKVYESFTHVFDDEAFEWRSLTLSGLNYMPSIEFRYLAGKMMWT